MSAGHSHSCWSPLDEFGTIQVKALLRKEAVLDRRRPNLIAVGLSLLAVFALYCTWAVLAQSKGLAHFWDKYGTFVGQQSPLLMCPLLINTLLKLGYEKRSGTKSLMLQMGLQQRTYFMSYVVHELAWSLPLTLVLALLSWATMFGGTISGFLPVWLWFLFYYISAIPSNFLLTSLISSDKYLVVFGVIWFYFLAILVTVDPDGNGNLEAKICLSILFPSANFAFATNSFRAFLQPEDAYVNPELRGVSAGSMWRIIDDQDLTDPEGTYNATSNMSLGLLYGMSMLNLALLSFLALWFEQVKPFEKDAGDRQSPFFFFKYIAALRSLIPGRAPRRPRLLSADVTEILAADEFEVCCVPVEKIPADLRAAARSGSGVCIRELRKSYPDPVTGRSFNAVNRLTLTMYQGQVTCLLGHNGAGKSSTLNCLTGNISITGGEVYVNGKSVRKEVREIQKMIGVCPQKNFLHDKLTVEQHLELFAGLKGLEGDDSRRHVNEIVARLDLEPKRHFLARNLSGGQKRKLHVGMAFMGGSRVVFLDEPTAGMDPYTRRSTWEVIQAYRSGRTIVLCTHYMDEADILSDRVAIMSAGALQCVGSTLFLKRLFGVGYNLTLVGEPRTSAEHCSSWLQMVQKHIPNASLLSMAGVEAQFQLPHEDASGQILSLLRALDAEKEGMRVSTYSLGATTLEEVYLRAARDDLGALENCPAAGSTRGKIPMVNSGEQRPASSRPVSLRSVDSEERQALPVLPSYEKPYVGTKMLLVRQMRAIWRVRLAVRFRRPAEVIWGFFVPLGIFVLLAVIEGITNMTVDTAPRVYGVLSSFGVFFITVPLGAFCVVDRIAGIKAQQILMGVTRPTYWLGLSSSDYFVGASIVTLFIIALAIVRSPCLHQGSLYASCFCVSLFLSLFCISWVVYRLSFAFTNKALCTATNMWVGIIFGIIGGLSVAALVKSGGASADVGRTLRWILRVVSPHFCVFDALEYSTGSSFLSENPNVPSKIYKETDPWEFEASGASIFFLAIHSVVWMALCAHAEMKTVQKSSAHLARHIKWDADVPLIGGIDPDVEAERERALGPEGAQSALALHEVRKVYPKQTLPAVRDVTLAVSKGECLGLLGVNGAGKTTTMGIITASVLPSSGSALIAGEEIYDKPDLLARHLGYCPQFDAQWGHITCEEHLYFCARCRGYTEADIPSVVHDLIELVGLSKHAFKHSRTLSGGNKRKLSLAMAVLGEPTVILLDEPSAGMDPLARQKMWRVVSSVATRCAVVITTHSMEEAEALAGRMAIMVAGRLRAFGTSTHLKLRFSVGFKLDVLVDSAPSESIEAFAEEYGIPLNGDVHNSSELETALEHLDDVTRGRVQDGVLGRLIMSGGHTVAALELASFACNASRRQKLVEFVTEVFPGAELSEAQGTRLTFDIPMLNLSLADMFQALESAPADVHIDAFTLGQTTLEQVFNSFAAQGAREPLLLEAMDEQAALASSVGENSNGSVELPSLGSIQHCTTPIRSKQPSAYNSLGLHDDEGSVTAHI